MHLPVISEFAPAKINLALHVTGQRPDGYHVLDSLVVFADVGDVVVAAEAPALSLEINGDFAAGLTVGEDNLVLRAAQAFRVGRGAHLTLTKTLPLASGIGGGSADAAATLRALARLWDLPLPDALGLGADVPACLARRPVRMRGIGEILEPLPPLPTGLALVLANPGVTVATPDVFRALQHRNSGPLTVPIFWRDGEDFALWLNTCRNDLEPAATALCPAIGPLIAAMAACPDCLLARMSGSGATVFGLFADLSGARRAAADLSRIHPDYWIRAASILP